MRRLYLSGEEATRIQVVLPVLNQLGWDSWEVEPEFKVGSGRVDYCLRIGERNLVLIEVKRASEDLENHQKQLLDYAFESGVEVAVLTNGLLWWLFLPLLPGSWDQRKFFTIDLLQQEPAAAARHFREYLERTGIDDGSAVRRARETHESREKQRLVQQAIPRAWLQLYRDPEESLLELLAKKVEGLCGHQPDHAMLAEFLAGLAPATSSVPSASPQHPTRKSGSGRLNRTAVSGSFTHKRPVAFSFRGERHSVSSFKDILVGLSGMLFQIHGVGFERVLTLQGRKRKYFSRDFQSMTTPAEIGGSGIYVETNLSADNIVARCRELLDVFGHPDPELEIEAENRS